MIQACIDPEKSRPVSDSFYLSQITGFRLNTIELRASIFVTLATK
jgi:hypothetical protein